MNSIFKKFKAHLVVLLLLDWHQTGAFLAIIGSHTSIASYFEVYRGEIEPKDQQKDFPASCQVLRQVWSCFLNLPTPNWRNLALCHGSVKTARLEYEVPISFCFRSNSGTAKAPFAKTKSKASAKTQERERRPGTSL